MRTAAFAAIPILAALMLQGCASPSTPDASSEAAPKATESAPAPAPSPERPKIQTPPYLDRDTGIMFPSSMGGFLKSKLTTYNTPALGMSVRYDDAKGSGAKADIYIYDLGIKEIKDGCDDKSVQSAFASALTEMSNASKKGLYKNLKFLSRGKSSIMMADGSPLPALVAETSMRYPDGREMASRLVVAGYRGKFVKVRFSCPASMGQDGEKLFSELMREFGQRLKASTKTSVDPELKESIVNAVREIEERPLSGGTMAMPALVAYAEDSEDVAVVLSNDAPWSGCKHSELLRAAFIGGNVRAQLERGVCEDSPLEGFRCVFKAYSKIREEDKSFRVPEIERLMELDAKGGLQKSLGLPAQKSRQ